MSNTSSFAREKKPVVCISAGDPAGIGAEIVIRALSDVQLAHSAKWVVVSSDAALRRISQSLSVQIGYAVFDKVLPDGVVLPDISVLDLRLPDELPELGKPSKSGGQWAAECVQAAVDIVLKKRADALVTAPISKKHLIAAGYEFPGHTEMIATQCGVKKPLMMLATDDLRVAVFTRHIPLKTVFMHLKKAAITDTIVTLARELHRLWGIRRPAIAVTGLNPHCGEQGLIGSEDASIIAPAIAAAVKKGVNAIGPISADTAFAPGERIKYSCILTMYHDQGLAPFKALSFGGGVNVTLNIPIIRTSPDHGTAFDIAPKMIADPSSMKEAMRLAVRLSRQ